MSLFGAGLLAGTLISILNVLMFEAGRYTGGVKSRPFALPSWRGTTTGGIVIIVLAACCGLTALALSANFSGSDRAPEKQVPDLAEVVPQRADVSGMDAAHKLCILSRLVLGKFIPLDEVEVKGIGPEIEMMVQGSKRRGKKVKLVAELYLGDTGIGGRPGPFVEPMEVSQDDCFYRVNGTDNIIEIETFDTGKVEMTGRGAGGKETATAVVSDLLSIATWLSRRKI